MTGIALHDENKSIRDYALSIIRSFGHNQSSLTAYAVRSLMEVVRSGQDQNLQIRAIRDLLYGNTDASLELLRELLDDSSRQLALSALSTLSIRDRKNFPAYMAHVLKRVFGDQFNDPQFFNQAREFVETNGLKLEGTEDPDTIAYLVAGALLPESPSYRKFSVEALFVIKLRGVVPLLERVTASDENEDVREKALGGLSYVLEADAEPYIIRGFDDPSPLVRGQAVETLRYSFPMEVLSKTTLKLEELATADPDPGVQEKAQGALKKIRGESSV
jgi:HEAT repeat protein